ncbi:GumC family protein [Celeribacter sp.]|uniref:GumC family protein n=1 Tax=Celeribacter sp. TaxID=1890673 RepID=UPI003A924272
MAEQAKEFDDEIDLLALLGTLWRGKFLILSLTVAATILGIAYSLFVATPTYTSSTTLAIQDKGGPVVDIESVVSGVSSESESLNTEVEVLKSRTLLERLATQLDLTSDPEFNPALRPEPLISVGKLVKLVTGREDRQPSEQEVMNRVVENLQRKISATVRRNTFVIAISVTTEDPVKSREIVNTLAKLYLEGQIEVKFETLDDAVTWLSTRVVELEAELEERNEALKARTSEADYVNAEGLFALNQQVREMRERLIGERLDADRAASQYSTLKAVAESGDVTSILELTQDPTLNRLAQSAPDAAMLADDSAFSARLSVLLERQQKEAERARTQVAALEEAIASMEIRVDEQATELATLQQLQREIDTTSVLYDTFLTRLKETTIQQGIQQADARVLSPAIDGKQVSPRVAMIAALSLVLGFLIGAALVLIREMRANGFRNAEELQESTGLQVIGQIPLFPLGKRGDLIQYIKEKPTSPAVEAVRNLRTSILLSNVDNPPQVIMSTSTIPGEGKTTQAISLVQNLSGMGKKVLLIEGDIRRRTLDEYFKADAPEHGLLSVISGDADLEDAVVKSDRIGADVLMGQQTHINAADVFSSEKFIAFLKRVREIYDYIIIDTPPVLVVPDARVIGQHCDAIMYTVKWDSTTKPQVLAALRELAAVNLEPTGLVLSQIDPKGIKKYGYGESYGAYSSYGSGYYDA